MSEPLIIIIDPAGGLESTAGSAQWGETTGLDLRSASPEEIRLTLERLIDQGKADAGEVSS
ncbi:hypothetical protein H0264_28930 [Nocardia huaxiensis]|uniref:Uncharacterized protein n=1 Tax=Nocardia huaxiensis TaxID=2755382 RepID=A0A7D6VCU1_9NOCA|nr:hypothetical protein [Nocardia huaxiensis]QLY29275.1 hypothetical protein H0264_28930 [Nocardia huaxiensis]